MASILKVDDLRGNTAAGNITITSEGGSATMQLQQGLGKVWFHFDGTSTAAIDDSFNVSSLDDDGTGQYGINYTNNMSGSHYAVGGNYANGNDSNTLRSMTFHTTTTSTVDMDGWYQSGSTTTQQDGTDNRGIVMGDLA